MQLPPPVFSSGQDKRRNHRNLLELSLNCAADSGKSAIRRVELVLLGDEPREVTTVVP